MATKAQLEQRIAELEAEVSRLQDEAIDLRLDRDHGSAFLHRSDDEIMFLRSIVHGLIPASLG